MKPEVLDVLDTDTFGFEVSYPARRNCQERRAGTTEEVLTSVFLFHLGERSDVDTGEVSLITSLTNMNYFFPSVTKAEVLQYFGKPVSLCIHPVVSYSTSESTAEQTI